MKHTLVLFALTHLVYFNYCKPNNFKPSLRLCLENGPLDSTVADCDPDCDDPRTHPCPGKTRSLAVECTTAGKRPAAECHQYYECVETNWILFSFYEAKLNTCPEGEAFDVEASDCEPAEQVGCAGPTSPASTVIQHGTKTESDTKIVEAVPPECKKAGKHPAVECSQYYECVNPIWWMFWAWEAKLNTCPVGQAFDVTRNDCNAAAWIDCLTSSTTTASTVENGTVKASVESTTYYVSTGVEVSSTDDEMFTTNEIKTEKNGDHYSTLPTVDDPTFNISTTESEAISAINGENNSTVSNGGNVSTFHKPTFSTTDVEIFTTNNTGTEISGEKYSTIEDSTPSINTETDIISTILTTIHEMFTTNEVETVISTVDSTSNIVTDSTTASIEIFTTNEMETKTNDISSEHHSSLDGSTIDISTVSTTTNEGGISTVDSILNESTFSTTDIAIFATNSTETEISSENDSIADSSTINSTINISINTETSTDLSATSLTNHNEVSTTSETATDSTIDSTFSTKKQIEESTTVKLVHINQHTDDVTKAENSTSITSVFVNNSSTRKETTKINDSSTTIIFFDNSSTASTVFADSTSNQSTDANLPTGHGSWDENTTVFSISGSTKFNNSEKHCESTEETTITDGSDSRLIVISLKKLLFFNIITYLLLVK